MPPRDKAGRSQGPPLPVCRPGSDCCFYMALPFFPEGDGVLLGEFPIELLKQPIQHKKQWPWVVPHLKSLSSPLSFVD